MSAAPWRAAFFGLVALGVLGGAGWALLGSSVLVVRHVQVTGATPLVPAAQVLAVADVRLGEPLSRVNAAAVARRVERIGPVASARVTRSFPDAVVIAVRQRVPALAVPAGSGYLLIDASGVTVTSVSARPAGLPVLAGPPAVLRGSAAVRAAAGVLAELPVPVRGQLVSVSAAPAAGSVAVTLHLTRGRTVLWGSTAQAGTKAAELSVLLRTHARYYDVSDPATAATQG